MHIFFFLGVVHLASTESTGGSTTGDDEESSDQQPSLDRVLLETRRNTHQNESIANSYRQAQEKLGFSDDTTENGGSGPTGTGSTGGACSLYPPSLPASFPPRSGKHRRDKSPSDLEADDENDHDSLNQSETGSTLSLTTSTTTTTTTSNLEKAKTFLTNSNTPVIRPTTPTGIPFLYKKASNFDKNGEAVEVSLLSLKRHWNPKIVKFLGGDF